MSVAPSIATKLRTRTNTTANDARTNESGLARAHRRSKRATQTRSMSNADASTSDAAAPAHAPSAYGKLMQSMNTAGIALFFKSSVTDRALAMPQVSCEDVSRVRWSHLKSLGFAGVVFDKDNTLTTPYALEVHEKVRASLEACKEAFGAENVAVYSNSAGLFQYDPDGKEADAMERALGIKFIRHATKKPAGDVDDVVAHFPSCDSAKKLIFVGEFPILLGTFATNRAAAILAAFGAVLAALYLLWAYQRIFHGPLETDANRATPDLTRREIVVMAPLIVLIIAIGLYPGPLFDLVGPSVDRVLAEVAAVAGGVR